jgi:tRNA uridine 5-carboxymethylaminomethyl modification enzyme
MPARGRRCAPPARRLTASSTRQCRHALEIGPSDRHGEPLLWLFQQAVDDLLIEGEPVTGVAPRWGCASMLRAVVLTTGTFLGGKIHIGSSNHQGGRAGDPPANTPGPLACASCRSGSGRLKTGTPPRIDGAHPGFLRDAGAAR